VAAGTLSDDNALIGGFMSHTWYYAGGDNKIGPLNLEQLKGALAARQNPKEVLVWREGSSKWVRAEKVSELENALPPALEDETQTANRAAITDTAQGHINWKLGFLRTWIVAFLCWVAAAVGWLVYAPLQSVLPKYLVLALGPIIAGLLLFLGAWILAGFRRSET
jgi:GYF domain 2